MSIRLEKSWQPLSADVVKSVAAQLGVFQVSNDEQEIIYIGYAGGKSVWGLRGALQEQLASLGDGHYFRIEINQQYLSRWEELLKIHMGDHGALPPGNTDHRPRRIGKLSLG